MEVGPAVGPKRLVWPRCLRERASVAYSNADSLEICGLRQGRRHGVLVASGYNARLIFSECRDGLTAIARRKGHKAAAVALATAGPRSDKQSFAN